MKALSLLLLSASLTFGATDAPVMMRGAKLAKPKDPDLVIGVNAVAGSVAQPGWPIIVSANKTVPASLNIKVTDEQNKEVAVAFERVNDFWIAGENTLKPGRYHITLVPAGDMRIESGDLLVGPSDADLLGLLKIQRALLTGKDDEALAEAERHPESADAWIAKGSILLGKDLPDEALAAYDEALKLRNPKAGENLALMARRRDAFFRSLEKRGVVPPKSPP
jgi:hypothetical protein